MAMGLRCLAFAAILWREEVLTKPERIELSQEELDALLERVESEPLRPGDYEVIKAMAETIAYLSHVADQKGVEVARLLRTLFGSKRETRNDSPGKRKAGPLAEGLDPSGWVGRRQHQEGARPSCGQRLHWR